MQLQRRSAIAVVRPVVGLWAQRMNTCVQLSVVRASRRLSKGFQLEGVGIEVSVVCGD